MTMKRMPTCIKILWELWLKDLKETGVYILFPIEYYYKPNCRRVFKCNP